MAAPQTIPERRTVESKLILASARRLLIDAQLTLDRPDTRLAHAAVAHAISNIDDAVDEL